MHAPPVAVTVRELADSLASRGVNALALAFVEIARITRVKAVPVGRLEAADTWGVGMSPCFDVYLGDDSMATGSGGRAGQPLVSYAQERPVALHPCVGEPLELVGEGSALGDGAGRQYPVENLGGLGRRRVDASGDGGPGVLGHCDAERGLALVRRAAGDCLLSHRAGTTDPRPAGPTPPTPPPAPETGRPGGRVWPSASARRQGWDHPDRRTPRRRDQR